MRTISKDELDIVSGGDSGWNQRAIKLAIATSAGTAGGVSMGMATATATTSVAEVLAVGTLGGIVAAGLTIAWGAGYSAGEWLNENTSIQGKIADVIDFMAGSGSLKNDTSYYQLSSE